MSKDLGEAFKSEELRRAVALRWNDRDFPAVAEKKWRKWEAEVSVLADGTRVNGVQRKLAEAIQQLKTSLDPKPWHDTLKFVTYDIPSTAGEAKTLAEAFIKRKENEESRVRIFELVPRMKDQPDTDMFMNTLILPFRSFVVAQLVSYLMEQVDGDDGRAPTEEHQEAYRIAERSAKGTAKKKVKVLTPSLKHFSQHSKDLDDVYYIESLVPDNAPMLKKHVAEFDRQGICTRFAKYCLIYMTADPDSTDDAFAKKLKPLAEQGLAVAQYDYGVLLQNATKERRKRITQDSDDTGESWLLRAAALGHSKAMLSLAKLWLTRAMNAQRKTGKKTSVAVEAEISKATSQAKKWLDTLFDAEWDEDTENDVAQGKTLLREFNALKDQEASKKAHATVSPRFWKIFFISVFVTLLAWQYATVSGVGVEADSTSSGGQEEITHNNKYRHRSAVQ